ncbi:MAG: DNA polymerase III subunit delta' [Caulobacterales bacterium]
MSGADEDSALHPRDTYDLLGHEEAEADLASALSFGRVHHAWLITGPLGVGKATLAYRAARILLGAKRMPGARPLAASPDDPVVQQIAHNTHPDLRILKRGVDEKTGKEKTEISVDDARGLSAFFGLSAGNGGRRIALIDTADELNRNAANALLKTIEEPPPGCVLFLICNAPGALPRTIMSRCRRLTLRAPEEAQVINWLAEKGFGNDDAQLASRLARNAPGLALTFAQGAGAARYKAFSNFMQGLGSSRGNLAAQSLIDAASARAAAGEQSALDLLFVFARDWLARAARLQAGLAADEIIPGENEAIKRVVASWNPASLSSAYSAIGELQTQFDDVNLDRGHTAAEMMALLSKIVP